METSADEYAASDECEISDAETGGNDGNIEHWAAGMQVPKSVKKADDDSYSPEWESEIGKFVLQISAPAIFFKKTIGKQHENVDGEECWRCAEQVVDGSNGNRDCP